MEEIRRYRCVKECAFDECDDDGWFVENAPQRIIEPGSVWQESRFLIAGGPENIHLDREDVEPNSGEWCEPLRSRIGEYFEQIESIYI